MPIPLNNTVGPHDGGPWCTSHCCLTINGVEVNEWDWQVLPIAQTLGRYQGLAAYKLGYATSCFQRYRQNLNFGDNNWGAWYTNSLKINFVKHPKKIALHYTSKPT